MKYKIHIRADGNQQIGLGHLVRCLAMAQMLKDDYAIVFFCLDIPEELREELKENGFKCIRITKEESFISQINSDTIVILDGYHFNTNYQRKVKNKAFKLVCIDDLHDKKFFADLIINHSPGINPTDYSAEHYTKYALGTEFAILRPSFIDAAKTNRKITKIDTAFVCFGGSDQFNLTFKTTLALLKISQIKKINVVVGGAYDNPNIFELEKTNPKIQLYKNLSEKELILVMQESNLAIVPSSNILFEIMAAKTPFIIGYYINNQKPFYNYLIQNSFAQGLGYFLTKTVQEIYKLIEDLLIEKTALLSNRTNALIDGKSPERILMKIKNLYHD